MFSPVVKTMSFLFFPTGGIGDVNISKNILPADPFVDLGHRAEIKCSPVITGALKIFKEICG